MMMMMIDQHWSHERVVIVEEGKRRLPRGIKLIGEGHDQRGTNSWS